MDLIMIRYKQEMQITLQNKKGGWGNLSMSEKVRQVQVILNVRKTLIKNQGV